MIPQTDRTKAQGGGVSSKLSFSSLRVIGAHFISVCFLGNFHGTTNKCKPPGVNPNRNFRNVHQRFTKKNHRDLFCTTALPAPKSERSDFFWTIWPTCNPKFKQQPHHHNCPSPKTPKKLFKFSNSATKKLVCARVC